MNLNVSKIKEESKKNYSLLDDISYDLEAFKNEKNGKKVEQKKKRTISFEANIYEEETSVNSSEDEDSEEEVNIKNKKSKENKFISKLAK